MNPDWSSGAGSSACAAVWLERLRGSLRGADQIEFDPEHTTLADGAFHSDDPPINSTSRLHTTRPMPVPSSSLAFCPRRLKGWMSRRTTAHHLDRKGPLRGARERYRLLRRWSVRWRTDGCAQLGQNVRVPAGSAHPVNVTGPTHTHPALARMLGCEGRNLWSKPRSYPGRRHGKLARYGQCAPRIERT